MKPILTLLAALFITTAAQARTADIYIVAGQSNGWRLSAIGPGPEKGSGTIHYFGMPCTARPDKPTYSVIENLHLKVSGSGLAGALLERSPQKEIVFIQYCVCGSSLGDAANWYPGDDPAHGKKNDTGLYGSFTRYLWWVERGGIHFANVTLPASSYSARGAGGHYILVVPKLDLVIVHRVNTDIRDRRASRPSLAS